jgi:calcineurin-like phosphoesterase family protein
MKRRKFIVITLPLVFPSISRAAEEDPELVFGVVADPQYADAEAAGSRFYRNSLEKLGNAVNELNRKNLAFVTTLGDLIDRDFESFADIMPVYGKLRHPHYPILGNHDFSVADEAKEKVPAAAGLEKPYYSHVIQGWRFIFLDGTDVALYRYPANDPRTKEARAMQDAYEKNKGGKVPGYNGAIGEKQMKWLKTELDAARTAKQRVILFNHFPVIPAGNGHNLWNAAELVGLLENYDNIAAYMNGHNHRGNYGTHAGIHFVNFKGMVETESETAYSVVRCFPDRLEIEGYGLEPDRNLGKI